MTLLILKILDTMVRKGRKQEMNQKKSPSDNWISGKEIQENKQNQVLTSQNNYIYSGSITLSFNAETGLQEKWRGDRDRKQVGGLERGSTWGWTTGSKFLGLKYKVLPIPFYLIHVLFHLFSFFCFLRFFITKSYQFACVVWTQPLLEF